MKHVLIVVVVYFAIMLAVNTFNCAEARGRSRRAGQYRV